MKYSYGIFPRITVQEGVNHAENNPFGISIDPTWYRYGAALAEERVEFQYTWTILALITLPLLALVAYFYWPLTPFAFLPAILLLRLPQVERYLELIGHSVYSSAASQIYGVPIEQVVQESAESLHSAKVYPFFHDTPVEQIYTRIFNRLGKANSWVFNHLSQLARDIKIAKEKFNV